MCACATYDDAHAMMPGNVSLLWLQAGLLARGYQVHYSLLNAPLYGIPAERRRLVLLAAAPSERLPRFPTPTHRPHPSCAFRGARDAAAFAEPVDGQGSKLPLSPTVCEKRCVVCPSWDLHNSSVSWPALTKHGNSNVHNYFICKRLKTSL
eukprot:SAG11_NODE_498_length_8940_cov_11.447121_10_plen_151_part_00